jgi:crotonobetainyl-CoA:carnitine CoA-transferase CaiB-like acyl-CoA transferase
MRAAGAALVIVRRMTNTESNASPRPGPLAGLRVLALEQMQALPFATQLLGFLGAEVVKVEHPVTGDSGRGSRPALVDVDGREVGATYLRTNLNKRSLALDLKHPEGVALLKRLVPRFDVFGENFKPGTLDRYGLGYRDLSALHPGLVYVSISGFGNLGHSPYRERPAYAIVAEAMGGLYELMREPGDPTRLGSAGALGDIGTGLFAAIGVLAALRERERSGRGRHVDVAMFDAVISLLDLVPFMHSMGIPRMTRSALAGVFDVFACRDGRFVAQAVRDHQLAKFAQLVGHPEWLADPRLAAREGWTEQLEALIRPAVEAWARDKAMAEVVDAFTKAELPAAPSYAAEDIARDPHVAAHQMLLEVERPDGGPPLRIAGNPIKLDGAAPTPAQRWPALGEHGAAILREELGLADAEIERLRKSGAIG